MGKPMRLSGFVYIFCSKCKVEYDLAKLSLEAKRSRKRNLYCPNCGNKVGVM